MFGFGIENILLMVPECFQFTSRMIGCDVEFQAVRNVKAHCTRSDEDIAW